MTQPDFPLIDDAQRIVRLRPRDGRLRVVIDTDTFNEVDDQFALAYALRSADRLQVEAIYAAPFTNARAASPESGMRQSHDEILRLLALMHRDPSGLVLRGSTAYLDPRAAPERSEAALDLVERAMSATPEDPLQVVALAALTNVASALRIEPRIINNIVLVWLGGHALHWPDTFEFNLRQDIPAARLALDCGVPLILIPCEGVTRMLSTTVAELERYLEPTGPLGGFLTERVRGYSDDHLGWSKPIWDMAPVAQLIDARWTPSDLVHSPRLSDHATWSHDASRHLIRCVRSVERDAIFRDFFVKMSRAAVARPHPP